MKILSTYCISSQLNKILVLADLQKYYLPDLIVSKQDSVYHLIKTYTSLSPSVQALSLSLWRVFEPCIYIWYISIWTWILGILWVLHLGFPYMNTDRPYCFSEQILTLFMWTFSICLVMRVQSLWVDHKNFKLMESICLFKIDTLLLISKSQSTHPNSFVDSDTVPPWNLNL